MTKQISNGELAEIVTGLLVGRLASEQLDSVERYSAFMTDLARLVCDHCGGKVSAMPADNSCEQWLVGIHSNECLPEDGGVWGKFDLVGEMEAPEGDLECHRPPESSDNNPTAVVWLEGGIVQWVASNFPMRYLVLDADTDGLSEGEMMEVTMENGSVAEVVRTPYSSMSDCLPAWVAKVVDEVESKA